MRPREFFGRPWSGEGRFVPRPRLGRWARPRSFRFRTSTSWLSEELWLVHDETRWEDGRVERRDGVARLVAPNRIRLTYDGMLGGTELHLHAAGYTFSPYVMAISAAPLPVPLLVRCIDRCELKPDGSLVNRIDLRFMGIPVGRQLTRLCPERWFASSDSSQGAPLDPQ